MRALAAALALWGAGIAAAEPPPLPPALVSVVVNGEVQPGDFSWLRGRFAGATDADKAQLVEIKAWLKMCAEDATEAEKVELAALGLDASALEVQSYGEQVCGQFGSLVGAALPAAMTFEEFTANLAEGRPILDAWVAGGRVSAEMVLPRSEVGAPILQAVAADQTLRKAMSWEREGGPPLSDPLMAVLRLLISQRISQVDRESTAMLQNLVANHGWPTNDRAGEEVASGAWLLVQHADQDPSWQIEALRLLQPLVARKQVSARDVAYLTDRVEVKLSGRQTYGTQFHCVQGHSVPWPIEEEAAVDERRNAADLPPLADYKQLMAEKFGDRSCPK